MAVRKNSGPGVRDMPSPRFVKGTLYLLCLLSGSYVIADVDNSDQACHGDICYTVIRAPKTVEEADNYCTQLGSRLLKIEHEETYNFIQNTLSTTGGGPFWIGATLSRPTNGRESTCGYIEHSDNPRPKTDLSQDDCFDSKQFVCTASKTGRDPICPLGYTQNCLPSESRMCSRIVQQEKSWFLADQFCRESGGNLALVDGELSKPDFGGIINRCARDTRRRRSKRSPPPSFEAWNRQPGLTWTWTDGSQVTFTKWFEGPESTPSSSLKSCVQLQWRSVGGWGYVDESCAQPRPFICQKAIERTANTDWDEGNTNEGHIPNPGRTPGPRPGPTPRPENAQQQQPNNTAMYAGIGVGIGVLVILVVVVIVVCLRKHHKKELQKVILRANSNVYRNHSQVSNTNLPNMSSVAYDGYNHLAVVTNGHAYQGLNPGRDSEVYEDIHNIEGEYSSADDGQALPTGSPHPSPPNEARLPEPPPLRGGTPGSSGYEYIDESQLSRRTTNLRPSAPNNSYLQILPPTPVVTPHVSPRASRIPGRQLAMAVRGNVQGNENNNNDSEGRDAEEIFVDNDVYDSEYGRSSKRGVATISSPNGQYASSQL